MPARSDYQTLKSIWLRNQEHKYWNQRFHLPFSLHMMEAEENSPMLCKHSERKCPLWGWSHTVMSDENMFRWNGAVLCFCKMLLCGYSWGLESHTEIPSITVSHGARQCTNGREPNKKSQLCPLKGLMPPLSFIVPSWMSFYKWSLLAPICPPDLMWEATSCRKPSLTTSLSWTHQVSPPSSLLNAFKHHVSLCTGHKHCLVFNACHPYKTVRPLSTGAISILLVSAAQVPGGQWELWVIEGELPSL